MLNSIKSALVDAHNANNQHAINKSDCERLGVPEQALDQWVSYVNELRSVTVDYLAEAHKPDKTDKELTKLRGAIYAKWKSVLKQGTEKDFSRAFHVRPDDVVHIAGLCGEKFIRTAKGTRMAAHSSSDFRRNIERLVGVRMVVGGFLDDETANTILDYEGALKAIKSSTEAIEGYKRGKEQVPGLKTKVAAIKGKLAKQEEFAKKFKIEGDALKEFLSDLKVALEETEKELKDMQAKLADATKKRDNLVKKYESTMAKIHTIDESF